MIDRIAPVETDDNDQAVPIWMLNDRINQINNAINQIQFALEWIKAETE